VLPIAEHYKQCAHKPGSSIFGWSNRMKDFNRPTFNRYAVRVTQDISARI